MPPSLQRPLHRRCRGTPLPRSFPGFSRARETGPPEASSKGPHRLPRRRKSHGLRIRGCRKSRECLLAFDCSSSSNRSRGFGLGNGGGGTENIADLQITTLKSKRLLPSRFKVGKLTFSIRLFPATPLSPSLQRPGHRGCRGTPLPRSFPGFSRVREIGPPEAAGKERRFGKEERG